MKKIIGALVIIVILIACICFFSNSNEGYVDITPYELEKIVDNEEQVYAFFYSENCVTCRKIKSNLKELKKEDKDIKVYGINADKYLENRFIEDNTGYKVPKVIEFVDGNKYKELEDKSMDSLREFIVLSSNKTQTSLTGSSKDGLDIYYFYSTTCSECEKTSAYLEEVKKKYNYININKFNIYEEKNMAYLKAYCKEYNVKKEEYAAVPVVFIRDKYIVEYDNIKKNIDNYIMNSNIETKVIDYNLVDSSYNVDLESVSILKIIGAALVNGINPCSISMLLFLIMLLNNKSKGLIKKGFAFCLGKAVAMLLIGTVLFRFLKYLSGFYIINVLNYVFAGVFIFLAMLNIYDFIMIKRNKYGKIKAQLPTKFRRINHNMIRQVVDRFAQSKWIVYVCFILGMAVAATEFLCSGQIYLSTIVTVVQNGSNNIMQGIIYLIIYCVICIVPLMIIILIMYRGVKEIEVSTFITNHLDKIKLIYALVFIVVSIYMIINGVM